jgi:hypothetical protein
MATISKRAADELDAELDGMKSENEAGSEDMNELNEEEYEKERLENIKWVELICVMSMEHQGRKWKPKSGRVEKSWDLDTRKEQDW